jgi:hypothetical protein
MAEARLFLSFDDAVAEVRKMEWLKHSGIAFLQAGGATALIMAFCPKEYWPAALGAVAFILKMRGIAVPAPGGVDAAIASGAPDHVIARTVQASVDATKNPFRH